MEKQFAVYILTNTHHTTLYIGVTSNLIQRVWQHKNKVMKGFTDKYNLHKLVYFELHESAESAIRREKRLKEWQRKWKTDMIEVDNPQWRDLYDDITGASEQTPSSRDLIAGPRPITGDPAIKSRDDGIASLLPRYDAFLIDLWGVVHDGSSLYPGTADAITHLHETGKRVIFLSNAPRRASMAEETLTQLGIARHLYIQVLTSGEAAHQKLQATLYHGRHYYYLGPSKDENVISDLDYIRTDDPAKADFILNSGFEDDYQPTEEIEPLLLRLLTHKLPLLCINPDMEVVKQDGTRLLCAGWVADYYARAGGMVDYIGKPYPLVYETALGMLQSPDTSRILAIGDNLHTDILGANQARIDSLLITGGILKSEHGKIPDATTLDRLIREAGAKPDYIIAAFTL